MSAAKDALNEMMLAKAKTAEAARRYDQAFECLLAVLAVDTQHRKANVLLSKMALDFLVSVRGLRPGDQIADIKSFLETLNGDGELIGDPSVRLTDESFLSADERRALVGLAREELGNINSDSALARKVGALLELRKTR